MLRRQREPSYSTPIVGERLASRRGDDDGATVGSRAKLRQARPPRRMRRMTRG